MENNKPKPTYIQRKYEYTRKYIKERYNNDLEYSHNQSLKVCINRLNKFDAETRAKKIEWLARKHPERLEEYKKMGLEI